MEMEAGTGEKVCQKCGKPKRLKQFYIGPSHRRTQTCEACRRGRISIGKTVRFSKAKEKYGFSAETCERMWKKQGHKCAVCGWKTRKPVVDHDHVTGRLRGILCSNCNSGIGMLGDTIEGLEKAILYLEQVKGIQKPQKESIWK